MNGLLQFNSQEWKLWSPEGLTLFLPRRRDKTCIYYSAQWLFIPPGVEDEDVSPNHPKFHLNVIGPAWGLDDWRNLAGKDVSGNEPIFDNGELVESYATGPDLFVHPPGQNQSERPDGWDTQLTFGDRDGYEFEFEMKAWRPTPRASEASREHQLKLLKGEEIPWDWEKFKWLEEGDSLDFSGRVRFEEICCNVPINSPQPVEWARQLARRELKLDTFGSCRVNGADWCTGKYQPADGIGAEGRLVVLNTPPD